jgi:ethanolamine ammonia-lyase large subunit
MGVPGADDIMLNYQSTSFHDALVMRQTLGLRAAPEFEAWLQQMEIFAQGTASRLLPHIPMRFANTLKRLDAA